MIDYGQPRRPNWRLKEALVFDALEARLMAETHKMLHMEHVIMASTASEEGFRDESDSIKARYSSYGRLTMPWLRWAPQKTAVQAYNEAQERRKDPAHMAKLLSMQDELDTTAKKISDAVAQELEIRQQAVEHSKDLKRREKQAARRRRHVRLPRGTRTRSLHR